MEKYLHSQTEHTPEFFLAIIDRSGSKGDLTALKCDFRDTPEIRPIAPPCPGAGLPTLRARMSQPESGERRATVF
jgi:hypothetical protein